MTITIHKLKKHQNEIPYVMISRDVVQSIDNPLALAIWVYLQSKSDDWKVVESDIMIQFKVGKSAYLKAMRCLRKAHLYSVERIKNDNNQFIGSVFHVYEKPTSMEIHTYGNPQLWNSTTMENHIYIKEEEITKEKEIITKKKKSCKSQAEIIESFIPNKASEKTIRKKYPTVNINTEVLEDLTDTFKDSMRNRKAPWKDIQATFRTYIKGGFIELTQPTVIVDDRPKVSYNDRLREMEKQASMQIIEGELI